MRVSVVIPVFNGKEFLGEAVQSVLSQTRPPDEVVIVNDGSTDDTPAIIDGFGSTVRRIDTRNVGAPAAFNVGLERATGDWIASIDADDLWTADKLRIQCAAAEQNVPLIFGLAVNFHADGRAEAAIPGYSRGTMLAERSMFERVGPLDPELRRGDFVDWIARARDLGERHVMLPVIFLRRRLHETNMGRRDRNLRSDYALVAKRALDRRRGAGFNPGPVGPASPEGDGPSS